MTATRRTRRTGGSGWAFQATNAEVLAALARGEQRTSLRELFGTQALEELSALAVAAAVSPTTPPNRWRRPLSSADRSGHDGLETVRRSEPGGSEAECSCEGTLGRPRTYRAPGTWRG